VEDDAAVGIMRAVVVGLGCVVGEAWGVVVIASLHLQELGDDREVRKSSTIKDELWECQGWGCKGRGLAFY